MQIQRIFIENFRNYGQTDIPWHQQVNLLLGDNAQGKSNLLEAICYLSLTTSFRGATEQELLGNKKPHFYVEADIKSEEKGDFTLSAAYERNKNKRWRLNSLPQNRKSDLVGMFHTVIFSPEDVDLVKAGPGERRRFLNRQISQLYPEHCRHLLRYNKALAQRNSLLRQLNQEQSSVNIEEALMVWDEQLAFLGAAIIHRRKEVLRQLTPLAAQLQEELSGGERLSLRYKSFNGAEEAATLEELQQLLLAELHRLRGGELARGITLAGPHRDDILIEIDNEPARAYASQGQQRTAALALKLAELHLARQHKGEWPVLLLDDVLSELDEGRRRGLLEHIGGQTQTFITSATPLPPFENGKIWLIEKGEIRGMG